MISEHGVGWLQEWNPGLRELKSFLKNDGKVYLSQKVIPYLFKIVNCTNILVKIFWNKGS